MYRALLRTQPVRIPRRNFNNTGLSIANKDKPSPTTSNVPANYEPPQPTIEAPKPIPKLQKTVSAWRIRLLWGSVGFGTAACLGYMKLLDEVRQANTELKHRLQGAHADVTTLHARLKDLEHRLSKVETHSTFNPPLKTVDLTGASAKSNDV